MTNLKFLKFKQTDNLWFFSDPHFGHTNICSGVTKWTAQDSIDRCRKFKTVEDMDNLIIDNINAKVKENDNLFCLGDWAWADRDQIIAYRNRIICKNLHLILGNHDKEIRTNFNLHKIFSSIHDYLEINVDDNHIIMSHYPFEVWNRMRHGSFHLFGHQHSIVETKLRNGKKIDIGLDGNNYEPYSWIELYNILKDRTNPNDQDQ